LLLTNQLRRSPATLIARYAQRMVIENSIADGINFFHMDALSSLAGHPLARTADRLDPVEDAATARAPTAGDEASISFAIRWPRTCLAVVSRLRSSPMSWVTVRSKPPVATRRLISPACDQSPCPKRRCASDRPQESVRSSHCPLACAQTCSWHRVSPRTVVFGRV
jgi:hypothetical protein